MSVAERLAALSPEQRALLDKLRAASPAATASPASQASPTTPPTGAGQQQPPPVRPVSGPSGVGDWPLSFDQERLWGLHQQVDQLVSWNVDAGSRFRGGAVDLRALLGAVHALVRRHAAWRTTFPLVDGRPVQRVAAFIRPAAAVIDLAALPAARREQEAHTAIWHHTRQPFDLARGPLLRLALVRLAADDHLCLVTLHHLVTDWISFQIFFGELLALYRLQLAGRAVPLPPPEVQFPDYALWERDWLRGDVLAAEQDFWRRELAGFPLALDLPAARPRPAVQSQRGGMARMDAGASRSARLRALARAQGATPFMAMLALLYALLWRLTGRERLVVGSNGANRPRPELQGVAGFFLTQMPFAADVGGDPTFRELLARSRRAALAAYAHQNLPFSLLVEALPGALAAAGNGLERNPVVQVMLLVLTSPPAATVPGGPTFEPVPLYDGNSRWDLMFGIYDDADRGLAGVVEFNADILDAPQVEGWVALLVRFMDAVTADPGLRLSQLPAAGEVAR